MQIKLIANEDGVEEWMMLELQGTFEFDDDVSEKILGHFSWRDDGSACLIVAHQIMEGELEDLQRPFIIVGKKIFANKGTSSILDKAKIIGVIRRKIVFRTRPKPVVMNLEV